MDIGKNLNEKTPNSTNYFTMPYIAILIHWVRRHEQTKSTCIDIVAYFQFILDKKIID